MIMSDLVNYSFYDKVFPWKNLFIGFLILVLVVKSSLFLMIYP